MPDKPAPKKPAAKKGAAGVGSFVTKQVGPLPAWGWGAVAVVAVLVWRGRKSTAPASAVPMAGTDIGSYDAGYNAGVNYSGGGAAGGGGGVSGPGTAIPATPPPPAPKATPAQQPPATPAQQPGGGTAAPLPVFAPLGYSLTPGELAAVSAYQQPQNQPTVNPAVSAAPVIQATPGTQLGAPTGQGQRYVTPWTGDGPAGPVYSFTYG